MNNLILAEKIAAKNSHTHKRRNFYPNVNIIRETSDGTIRIATYDYTKEGEPLTSISRSYIDKYTYNYEQEKLEPNYKDIYYDAKGNYYKDKNGRKAEKPFKQFTSFSELLDYFRQEKVKKDKSKTTIKNFFENLFTPNFADTTVDFSDKSLQGNALTRRIEREKTLIKPVKDRMNAKFAINSVFATGGLLTMLLPSVSPIVAICLSLPFITSNATTVFDKFTLESKSFFKKYKNMTTSQQYRNILQRAKHIYR